jgi:hypothetical protein
MVLSYCGLIPNNPKERPIPVEGHPIKDMTNIAQNCQDYPKQGKSEKLSLLK